MLLRVSFQNNFLLCSAPQEVDSMDYLIRIPFASGPSGRWKSGRRRAGLRLVHSLLAARASRTTAPPGETPMSAALSELQ